MTTTGNRTRPAACRPPGRLPGAEEPKSLRILGGGAPFFGELREVPVDLEGPLSVVAGTGVTHLRYRVAPKRP